jgi:hypothetical protein
MRITEIEFIKALTPTQVSHIIPILEDGLELQKLKYLATRDEQLRIVISDGCVLLSFLYFRSLGKAA